MQRRLPVAALALAWIALGAPASAQQEDVLRVSAPDALVPVLRALADAYTFDRSTKVTIVARTSPAGIAALRADDVDLAISDEAVKDPGLVDEPVAGVPLAVIASAGNGVTTISHDRLRDLLDGRIRSWSELGGRNVPIVRFERPKGSATQNLVDSALGLDPKRPPGLVDGTSGTVIADVRGTAGAVGVVVLPYAGDLAGVTVLAIDGHDPAAVREGYPLVGQEHAVTKGSPSIRISRFVAFLRGATARWREAHFLPMRDLTR